MEDGISLQIAEGIVSQIESILSKEKVIEQAQSFLESCGWSLEINGELVSFPKQTDLSIRSRAFIKADSDNVFCDDHYEAVVLIGGDSGRAKYGVLKMYFNLNGNFVSEDRYDKYS